MPNEVNTLKFILSCQVEVRLTAFHCADTYASLLEGVPDQNYNNELIQKSQTRMVPMWGVRPTYLIPPSIKMVSLGKVNPIQAPYLPPVVNHAWLTQCDDAVELVVIWFGHFNTEKSLTAYLSGIFNEVPWARVAMPYDP